MGQLEKLRPTALRRVYDLVNEAGLDVSDWANFAGGQRSAASNPKYCYNWAFKEPGRTVILNLWHAQLKEAKGNVYWRGNLRRWIERSSRPGTKSVWKKRTEELEAAIRDAATSGLTIRVIINDGRMRDPDDPRAKAASVERRELDPLPWGVDYNQRTGECVLTRGVATKGLVDQFDLAIEAATPTERISVQGTVFVRDAVIRAAALARAKGLCEFCGEPGFTMPDGRVFLETHHVIPLSENGPDTAGNVAAVCANHHREAHFGARATEIRHVLLEKLR